MQSEPLKRIKPTSASEPILQRKPYNESEPSRSRKPKDRSVILKQGEQMKKTIQTRLDQEDIEKLEKEAKRSGHTLSSLIRWIVKRFVSVAKL